MAQLATDDTVTPEVLWGRSYLAVLNIVGDETWLVRLCNHQLCLVVQVAAAHDVPFVTLHLIIQHVMHLVIDHVVSELFLLWALELPANLSIMSRRQPTDLALIVASLVLRGENRAYAGLKRRAVT